ncbi:TIGR01777 family oxidoreductase [Geothrix campi]|uniref:TIGR01777 family oxidoreductase n=1 Tax=Geothrix campi TaxID=2966450 RepID=UPI002147982D|nr:TIGR01777 family oxidoreductase [Geothrix sp. SG10]
MTGSGPRRVVVAGGTGLVGQSLVRSLLDQDAQVTVLTRNPARAELPAAAHAHGWEDLPALLDGADAVINLAGEGIADQRWSLARKAAIRDSRILATRRLVEAMKDCRQPPGALVNASAIGYYGARDRTPVDEAAPQGVGFLPEVCQAWEAEAAAASAIGVRVARIRIGVVLARDGGALPKMALPVRLWLGCKLGSGAQGLSWIHLDDLVAMFLEAARNPAWEGPFNGTAPEPLGNEAFTDLLARRLRRPLLPVPGALTAAAAKLALGEMATALLLQGAYVVPTRAQALGFGYQFPTAVSALEDLL